jgi:hypothetical protein
MSRHEAQSASIEGTVTGDALEPVPVQAPAKRDGSHNTHEEASHRPRRSVPFGPLRVLRNATRRLPTAAWVCILIAVVNGVCWSVIVPPFQMPDEPAHFAYVQHLAETGHLPSSSGEIYAPAEGIVLGDLLQGQVRFSSENRPISSARQQEILEYGLHLSLSRSEPGDAGVAASQPPLYYALATIPYAAGSDGTVLDRLALMRLLSALIGGLTVLFVFLFVRETLPGAPWAWTVGGLGVALAPLLGMMSGAVNPDILLFAISTALFYCFARAFRRGLSRRLVVAFIGLIAAGCATKITFLGLLPGAIVGLIALIVRDARRSGVRPYRRLALAGAITVIPICVYVILTLHSGRSLQVIEGTVGFVGHIGALPGVLSYIWQVYLPRLPGMSPTLHGISGQTLWFEQLVGKYGWLDTAFPAWVVKLALVPVGLISALLLAGLFTGRASLWARKTEVVVYALMSLGILIGVAAAQYHSGIPGSYLQLRYLLPLIGLAGVALALAARGAGARWGPLVGAGLVLVILLHDLSSQLLVISRYYG